MKLKIFGIGIIILLSVFLCSNMAYAEEIKENSSNEAKIYECINNECSIDALYEMRGEYSLDFENNYEVIEAIDNRLEELGVEEISYYEVVSKLNNSMVNSNDEANINTAMARVALNPSTTVKWTSTRQTTVYRGKTYEIQIIRGVPATGVKSELVTTNSTTVSYDKGFKAALRNAFGVIVGEVAGKIPKVGSSISTIKTFYDLYKDVISGLTGQTTINDVETVYYTTLTSNYLYSFKKYSGDADTGNQILGYAGNSTYFECTSVMGKCILYTGEDVGHNIVNTYKDTIISPGYSDYIEISSNNFYNYKNGINNITTRYNVSSFSLQSVKDKISLKIPQPYSGY